MERKRDGERVCALCVCVGGGGGEGWRGEGGR